MPVRKPPARSRPRVAQSEKKIHMASAKLSSVQTPKIIGSVQPDENGVVISAVVAETVPVAQFANVVVGPVGVAWRLGGINMEDLVDVDWGSVDEDGESTFSYESMTPPQRAAYDRVLGALRATIKVGAHAIAEERETIEISIRKYNEREAEAEEADARKEKAERQRRRAAS